MAIWFAFLRGINLGNRQMRMAELKAALEASGYTDVKTVAASGNVRFEAEGDEAGLKASLEKLIAEKFKFEVGVVLRANDEMQAMLDDHPFNALDRKADLTRHVLMFDQNLPEGVELTDRPGDTEILRIDPREIYMAAYRQPNGRYTENVEGVLKPLYAQLGKGVLDTMRNWNTMEKMLK